LLAGGAVRSLTAKNVRVLLRVACAAVLVAVLTQTRADPDLFGHVRFGHDIVAARSAHLVDRYSFTSDRPWINHEWLAEVVMYGAYNVAGAPGLIALKLSLLALMLALWRWRSAEEDRTTSHGISCSLWPSSARSHRRFQ